MKVIRKSDMVRNTQEGHLRAERDFLVASEGSRCVVPLMAAFQDSKNLNLAMEYCIDGDLCRTFNPQRYTERRYHQTLLIILLKLDLSITFYTMQNPQFRSHYLTDYLCHEFEIAYLAAPQLSNMYVGMLIPCHSTSWPSHLHHAPTSTHQSTHT